MPMKPSLSICLLGLLFMGSSCQLLAQGGPYGPGQVRGTVQDPNLREISGVVASRRQAGILWVHNDSGDKAQVYALSVDGVLRAQYTVVGAQNRDWEDIALGPGPEPGRSYLYLGDIGDNGAHYPTVTVYRVPEPNVPTQPTTQLLDTAPSAAIRLVYPDGPRDAETLLIDPVTGDLFIISKRDLFSRVYRAPAPLTTDRTLSLSLVTLLPWGLATGGDIAPDGSQILVRSLNYAMLWQRPLKGPLWENLRLLGRTIELGPEPQGEAICFGGDQQSVISISEGTSAPIYVYPLNPSDPSSSEQERQ